MPYCKHCEEYLSPSTTTHHCPKAGKLDTRDSDDFIVSAIIGAATDSALLGGLLGGSILGGILGDSLDLDLFD